MVPPPPEFADEVSMEGVASVRWDSGGQSPASTESALETAVGTGTVPRLPKGRAHLGRTCSAYVRLSVCLDRDKEEMQLHCQAAMAALL